MAYKFEIKSNAVVVTDTATSEVLIAQPAKNTWFEESRLDIGSVSLYGMSGTDQDNINRYKYDGSKGFPLNECQDGAGATFSADSFRDWCYANLASFSQGGGSGQGGATTDELFTTEKDSNGNIIRTISKYDFQVPPQSIEIGDSIKISDLAQEPTYTTKFDAKQYLMMGYEFGEQGSTMPSVKVFGESTSFDLQPLDDVTQNFNTPVLFTITSQQDVIGETYTLKLNASSDVRLEVFREAENGGQEAKLVDEIIPQSSLSLDGVSFKLNPIVDFVSGKLYTLKFTATSGQIDVKGTGLAVGGTYGVSKADNTQFFPYIRRERGYVYESRELALKSKGNADAEFSHYSIKTNVNIDGFFDDGLIKLSWQQGSKHLEIYMLTEPQGTGDLVSYATKGNSSVNTNYITQPNYKYDVYPSGINATEGLIAWISAEDDVFYPSYKIYFHNAGTSYNSNIEIKKIIPKQ